jgi:hypothetical protein
MPSIPVAKHYLSDIQGTEPFPTFDKLIEQDGLLSLVPESVKNYADQLEQAEDQGVHQYLCNIDKSPDGCKPSHAIAERDRSIAKLVGYVRWDTKAPLRLLYSINGQIEERNPRSALKAIPLAANRQGAGKNLRGNNLKNTILGQGLKNTPRGEFLTRSIKSDRSGDSRKLFRDAVNGDGNLSIGDRAILFNQDGSITTGANNIRDNAIGIERSSNFPSESISNGSIPAKIKTARAEKTSQHPNKARIAKTNDITGGIAALGGLTGVIGIIALLVPQHFITSAITFLTSITTFFTNVNNAVNTYLTVADALLGIFGIKGSAKKLKGFVAQIVDNALGKENVQESKNNFAAGINSIAVTTKLLESTQQILSKTDDKVDNLALRLGGLNNLMGEQGLIPAELMATSKGIDTLVETRSKTNEDLGENITKLTSEIQNKDEARKLLKEEQVARDKIKAKNDKDLGDVKALLDVAKTDVDKIKVENL